MDSSVKHTRHGARHHEMNSRNMIIAAIFLALSSVAIGGIGDAVSRWVNGECKNCQWCTACQGRGYYFNSVLKSNPDGYVMNSSPCEYCDGKGILKCVRCQQKQNGLRPVGHPDNSKCTVCRGCKVLGCGECNGTGFVIQMIPSIFPGYPATKSKVVCPRCRGNGSGPCPACRGRGKFGQ